MTAEVEDPTPDIYRAFNNCIVDQHFTKDDQNRLLALLTSHPAAFRTAMEQIILKTIQRSHFLSSAMLANFENFFTRFFRLVSGMPPSDAVTPFVTYFFTFFGIASFTNNHFVKGMLSKYLLLLVESPAAALLHEGNLLEIFDAAFGLIKDVNVRNRITAIKIFYVLQQLRNHDSIREKAQGLLMQACSVDSDKKVRVQAALKVALDGNTIDVYAFRVMDVSREVGETVLKRLVAEGWRLSSMRLNTRYFLASGCNNSLIKGAKDDLLQLILPSNPQEDEGDTAIHYRRLLQTIADFRLEMAMRNGSVDKVVRDVLSHAISRFKLEDFRLVLQQIFARIFPKKQATSGRDFEVNLYLLLHIWDFLKLKIEEGFVAAKTDQRNKSLAAMAVPREDPADPADQPSLGSFGTGFGGRLEDAERIPRRDEVQSLPQSRLSVSRPINPEDYARMDQQQTYRQVLNWIDESMPTGGRIFHILQEALTLPLRSWEGVIRAELLLRLLGIGNVAETNKDKFVEAIQNFLVDLRVPLAPLDVFVKELNTERTQELGVDASYGIDRVFLPPLEPTSFIVEWTLCGKKDHRPLLLQNDVLASACATLHTLLTDDGNAFVATMIELIARLKPSTRRHESCAPITFVTCFFMEEFKGGSDLQAEQIEQITIFLFKRIESSKKSALGKDTASLLEVVTLKALGLLLISSIPRMLTLGNSFLGMLVGDMAAVQSPENKVVSCAIFFDFLIKFSLGKINTVRQAQIREHVDLLDLEIVLETLKRYLLEESDPLFRTVLVKGFCRLFQKNWRIPLTFHMDPPEFVAILLLLWTHNLALKDEDAMAADQANFLSTFVMMQSLTSPDSCANLLEAILVVLELVVHMRTVNFAFNKDAVNFEVERLESVTRLLTFFISLTLQEVHHLIASWYFDRFLGSHPQEFLILYLVRRGEDVPELLPLANSLVIKADFWERDNPKTVRYVYQKTLRFAKEKQHARLGSLASLNLRLEASVVPEELTSNAVIADLQERDAFLDDRAAALKATASSLFKTLKDGKKMLREPKMSELYGHQREPSKRVKRR